LTASKALIARVSDAQLETLAEPLHAMEAARSAKADYATIAEHDFAFHRRLVALAGNRRMTEIYDTMLAQTALLLRTAAEANPTLRSDLDRPVHGAILDALQSRDVRLAREAVEEHYRYAEERLFAQISGG
jgi:DNA-binding GntR family transcriptional regulator